MLRSYIIYGLRHLLKSKAYSVINITGLAIGLACCIGISLFISDELSFDKFHSNIDNLYRVVEKQKQAGEFYNVASTPGPLGPAMKADLPEVVNTCRIGRMVGTLLLEQKSLEPSDIRLTDNSFFSMFSFQLLKGNAGTALLRSDELVLTSTMASQLFDTDWQTKPNVLGSTLKMTLWGEDHIFTLAGIVADPPINSHLRFDVLLPMSLVEKEESFIWDNNSYNTYIQLNPSTDVETFDQNLRTYIDRYSEENSKDDVRTLKLQPMKDIYLHSNFDFDTDDARTSSILYIRVFIAVGLMILLIAIFNFVNLSTARATHRAREVGVRKVAGALYNQLVTQFLAESLLITSVSVVLALALIQVFLPLLNTLSGKALHVPLEDPFFLGIILAATILIGILAGVYPAFYLSSFRPAKVLKGSIKIHSGISFRRMLVIGQFAFSIILVISSIVIYRQLQFMREKELGLDRSQLIYIHLKNTLRGQAYSLKPELMEHSSILAAAVTTNSLIDVTNSTWSFEWEGQQKEDQLLITHMNTDADLMQTLGMRILTGRNFHSNTPDTTSYLINETAAQRMGWTNQEAIGKSVALWKTPGTVVGVVKDFHFRPMTKVIEPFLLRCWPKSGASGVFIKTQPNQTQAAIAHIEKIYKARESQTTLQYQFFDQALDAQYRMQQNTGRIVLFFSVLAVFVSCLGLFGLATFATEQRTKEIGIRKVLGASVTSIVRLLSNDFTKLVVVSILIASPIAWWSLNQWLEDFVYKINIEWWMFIAASVIAILVAFTTVSYHAIKTAMMNPVKSLRAE